MTDQTGAGIARYGHGMLPEHPQMECIECGAWSYLAARTNGRAGRCFGCEMADRDQNGSGGAA